ncbi:CD3324 family protein [Paenibacillus rhizovicinus]|uniref:CD3324 family protein n=1 Tax=Paenibacillus rhizovicinus TaxID=2704463 RepID=UPI00298BE484|nr:CD3324 family protein [Paenibacillus rhizovicinus]
MKYENANDVIPEELLKEIQKYAAGKLLYIPSPEGKRAWGETSGYRDQLQKRNRMIRNKYAHGLTVSDLADEYFLSLDSIKKIIYSKQGNKDLAYSPTLESAVHYANAGMMEEWVQCYLLLTRKAAPMVQALIGEHALCFGVIKFPLRLIQPEAGSLGMDRPSENDDTAATQPLLLYYEDGKFYCTAEQELLASLQQRKVNAYPAIIVLQGNAEYKRFMKFFGNIFIYVDQVGQYAGTRLSERR